MKRLNRLGWVVVAVSASALAVAQVAIKPAKSAAEAKTAIETRQALFKDIKKAYEPMIAMMKNQQPFDAAVIATNAARIQELSVKIPEAFAVDTRAFKETKTEAQDRVWLSQVEFKAKTDATVQAAGNLAAAAKTGDKASTMKAIPAMGKTCGGCHDIFKFKE
ncbi:MAG: cytochrome c [Proteobacteria bacterium]|jgi:cytochrome c556|nr:cytochrome c [Pseudomonadota bacterium]MBK7116568.1 cytochrome c [Pseudomonadota bacterium]MBK9251495.1 cytochrome c [Pseudomonadota bacterium]MCC6633001.1 cytochrome c [Gammaproteobacteria bacterium]